MATTSTMTSTSSHIYSPNSSVAFLSRLQYTGKGLATIWSVRSLSERNRAIVGSPRATALRRLCVFRRTRCVPHLHCHCQLEDLEQSWTPEYQHCSLTEDCQNVDRELHGKHLMWSSSLHWPPSCELSYLNHSVVILSFHLITNM